MIDTNTDAFEIFLKAFGAGYERKEVPQLLLNYYQEKLPELLLNYWQQYGWCGYANGAFWMVNPKDYEAVVNGWLEDSGLSHLDKFHVIARSAFGDLYLWGEQTGFSMKITSALGFYNFRPSRSPGRVNVQVFFITRKTDADDHSGLLDKAFNKLGGLRSNEMFGFFPALAMGGPATLETIEKVKAVEHLTFLSQLEPLRNWGFPDIKTVLGDIGTGPDQS